MCPRLCITPSELKLMTLAEVHDCLEGFDDLDDQKWQRASLIAAWAQAPSKNPKRPDQIWMPKSKREKQLNPHTKEGRNEIEGLIKKAFD